MKSLVLFSAMAAGLAAAAPAPAKAADLSFGLSIGDGQANYLTLAAHDRRRCQSWRRAHRKLHRRFDDVRLRRRVYNRRGHKVFIAHARRHHGGPRLRIRYNACTRRVTKVRRLGHHHRRHGRRYCLSWRRAHRRLHRRFDDVELIRRTRNRRGHRIFIVRARPEHRRGRLRVRYNACKRRVTKVRRLGRHHHDRHHRRDRRWHRR